ncbi:polysaccharide biosynthesis C-terminal domain-containing protein [Micromonospora sp. H33]|uniref:polysaccharide biosynthesis C-terminal domain-containing protein n=1 Tax=Micromonospora sp. H33 TaxID=3452215 RepID=UPI003F8BDEB1
MTIRSTESCAAGRQLAITGAGGFLGWHVRVLAHALGWPEPVVISRAELSDADVLAARLDGVDRVLHLAGVNLGEPATVAAGNVELAAALVRGLRRCAVPPGSVVFANSVLAGDGTPYGDSKAAAAATLAQARADLVDVRLPNLYGEHGRPFRNGVTATFCGLLADGRVPEVHQDRELTLVHVTDAAARLMDAPHRGPWNATMPGLRISVSALAEVLTGYATSYERGEIPSLPDRHAVRLFNTYRSHRLPDRYPIPVSRHSHGAGDVDETLLAHGAPGRVESATIRSGRSRGGHFHMATVKRVCVVRGDAEVLLRRVGHQDAIRLRAGDDRPWVIDVPTMWAYRIVNTGTTELVTFSWTNEPYDVVRRDTYPSPAEQAEPVPAVVTA